MVEKVGGTPQTELTGRTDTKRETAGTVPRLGLLEKKSQIFLEKRLTNKLK
jgi:hypothetical protein